MSALLFFDKTCRRVPASLGTPRRCVQARLVALQRVVVVRPPPFSERGRLVHRFSTVPSSRTTGSLPVLPASLDSLGLKYLERDELLQQFKRYDQNGDSQIDQEEARQMLRDAGCIDSPEGAAQLVRDVAGSENEDAKAITWTSFRSAADRAAEPVDRRVYSISGSLFLNFAGQGTMQPVLPLLARSLGLTVDNLGLVTAVNSLARIAANVPIAAAADRFGRRPLLIAGPLLGSASFAMMGFSTNASELMLWNSLAGLGGAATMGAAGLYLSDISTPRNRSRTMAPLLMMALVGFSLGPALGGFLAQWYSLQMPFFVCSAGMALAAASAAALLPETQRVVAQSEESRSRGKESVLKQWRDFVRRPALQGITTGVLFSGFATGAAPVTTILLASETLSMSPSLIGCYFTGQVIAMACVTPLVTKVSDNMPNRLQLIVPGLLLHSVALGLQSGVSSPEVFMCLGLGGAVGSALVMPNVSAYVIDNCLPQERAQALAMRSMANDVGMLMGASTMGFVAATLGVPAAMQITAGIQAAAAVFCGLKGKMFQPKRSSAD